VRLLSPKTIDRIYEVQSNGIDLVTGMRVRMGIGYGLPPFPEVLSFLPEGRLACWGGAGGSLVIADVDRRLTFAYVMNKMVPAAVGPVAEVLVKRLYEIVKR
jgi:CubicO group peptidase (beta-lactamase class C family)